MLSDIWFYTGSAIASFITVFLKVMQHKNVIDNHYRFAFINSYLMACGEVLTVSLIVKGGWFVAFSSGMGGSLGVVLSMYFHNRFFKKNI